MQRLTFVCAVACAAAIAWLSQGTLASTGGGGGRVAVLPLTAASLVCVGGVAAAVSAAWFRGLSLSPLWLLILIALPWIPAALPAVFAMWSGGLVLLVWAGVAVSMLASIRPRWPGVARPALMAGIMAGSIYAFAAWQVAPLVPGGDEPHYLIITQSLLRDGDLQIENNHSRGDHQEYYAGDLLKPDWRRRGHNGQIYSIHAPGLPALIAPAFAIAGYRGAVCFLILLAASGGALAWRLAWMVTGRADAAWFGWAAVTASTSAIFHGFAVYPDFPGGVLALTGIWALVRAQRETESGSDRLRSWWLHGAALAALPWLHTRFAVLAGSLGALVLLRLAGTRNAAGKAVVFLAVPALSALCWLGYFFAIYGTPDPSAPYGGEAGSLAFIPGGLAGLLFDQRFGLLAYAPVLISALAGLGAMLARREQRRLGLEILFVAVPYLLAVTHFAMWWGGTSAPARFLVPLLPLMTIPAAVGWTAIRHRATRATILGALVFTVFASSVLVVVGDGRLAFNSREGYARWLEWLNGAADLAHGVPAWWRGRELPFVRDIAIWIAAMGAAWGLLRTIEGMWWARSRARLCTAAAALYACAAMAATAAVWMLSAAPALDRTPAQLEVLRSLSRSGRVAAFTIGPVGAPSDAGARGGFAAIRRVDAAAIPALLRIEPPPSAAPGGAGPNDRPLFQVPAIPAGRYRLSGEAGAAGWIMLGIGRDQFSLRSGPITSNPLEVTFPVGVRAIVIRGDEQARQTLRRLVVEPLALLPEQERASSGQAIHAVRYGGVTTFFMDDQSFPEPEGFWTGGARSSSIVMQPDAAGAFITLHLRNAPVDNRVEIAAGAWREELRLLPGEERRLRVPLLAGRAATLIRITTSSGSRPSAVDAASRDNRFLGVWVKIVE